MPPSVLALIVLAGLAGPLLGAGRSVFVPVVIGEILAGVVVGRTGLDRSTRRTPPCSSSATWASRC